MAVELEVLQAKLEDQVAVASMVQVVQVIHLQHHQAKEILEEQEMVAVVVALQPLALHPLVLVDGVKAMVVLVQHLQLQVFL